MKAFFLTLFLLPSLASAATTELECEGAKLTFLTRWIRGSIVRLEGGPNWELPWTGREAVISGKRLRADRLRDMATTEQAAADELLVSVPEETRFVIFKERGQGQNPLARVLYVDADLLKGGEGDGLVIAMQHQALDITVPDLKSEAKVFHCRSR